MIILKVTRKRTTLKGREMCESNAYIMRDGKEELVMESVGLVKPVRDGIVLRSIFGEQTTVKATIIEMNLTGHRIVLEAI